MHPPLPPQDASTAPLTAEILLRACAELRPAILDTVPILLEQARA